MIGTGADGALPVMKEVHGQARRRGVDLVILPTAQAISVPAKTTKTTTVTSYTVKNQDGNGVTLEMRFERTPKTPT